MQPLFNWEGHLLACFVSLVAFPCLCLGASEEITAAELKFFEEHIRPVLSENCYKCHSEEAGKQKGGLLLDRSAGFSQGGDSGGAVINLEKPSESLLYKMVIHDPDYEPMPPKTKLSNEEIAKLLEWITMGAPDPRDALMGEGNLAKNEFNLEERKKWWSLQPLAEVDPPSVQDEQWPLNDYDKFLLAELESKNWKPAQETDRATLLRRASITLTGLAPTPEELERFLDDDQSDAYEKQVDRLLNSPHFGERWARHWMDVVRYADSKAFESDYTIPYGHEYRDYLVRTFNDDVPFDQFVREAFAGDLLENPRVNDRTGVNESVIGPGFFLFTDGQHGPPDLHEDESRVFNDMINTATVAFQGLTVACAKCHDHKFDAITAADYYSFYGLLRSSRLNYANVNSPSQQRDKVLGELAELKPQLVSKVISSARDHSAQWEEAISFAVALRERPEITKSLEEFQEDQKKRASKRDRSKLEQLYTLVRQQASAQFSDEVASLTEAWFRFLWLEEDIPELNGLRSSLLGDKTTRKVTRVDNYELPESFRWAFSGPGFRKTTKPEFIVDYYSDSIIKSGVGDSFSSGLLTPRLDGVVRSEDFILDGEPIELWARGRDASVQLVVRNYEMVGYGPTTGVLRKELNSDGLSYIRFPTTLWKGETAYLEVLHHGSRMKVYRPKEKMGPPSDDAYLVFPRRFSTNRWNNQWSGSTPSEIVKNIQTLLDEVISSEISEDGQDLVGALFSFGLIAPKQADPEIENMVQRGKRLQEDLVKPRYVRSMTEGTNYHEPVYVRGNHKQPSKEDNPKHFLDAFGGSQVGTSGSGRLEYAEHLLSTSDFLTARVRVNRIWTRIFGRGLVSSVDDLGKMGAAPSHPELLDYMARRYIEDGWSTKTLIRELMTTRAYRMSSVPSEQAHTNDPANIYLQRMPVQRMDAESVRDHILLVSGRLDRSLQGPIINPNLADALPSRAISKSGPIDGHGRRSIYQAMRRNYLPSFQRAFNLPNPSEPVGQRQTTTVPAQSLTLLNNPFVHQQAKTWADRLLKTSSSESARLEQLHLIAFSRSATEEEIQWGRNALAELREEGNEQEAWVGLCHIMINRKEFIYVF